LCVNPELPPCFHKKIHTSIPHLLLRRLKKIFLYKKKRNKHHGSPFLPSPRACV
jgi:hypothetical protein